MHFLDPEDGELPPLLLATKQYPTRTSRFDLLQNDRRDARRISYLGAEKAYEVVVKNTNMIADWCETVRPVPLSVAPKIKNSVKDLKALVYGKLHRLYGETRRN